MPRVIKPHVAAPTPIPAFAPVDKPLLGEELGVAETIGLEVGCVLVLDGWPVVVVLELELVLVVNSVRSFCWNSVLIGCPQTMIGPVTVVIFKFASLRAGTTALLLARG